MDRTFQPDKTPATIKIAINRLLCGAILASCIFIQTNAHANPHQQATHEIVTKGNGGMQGALAKWTPHVYSLPPDSAYTLGVQAYKHSHGPLALTYLEPLCQAAPHADLASDKQAMACYLSAYLHFQQHHAEQGERLLWHAVSLAPLSAQVAYPADLASMALRAPKGWQLATGNDTPRFIKIAVADDEPAGMVEGTAFDTWDTLKDPGSDTLSGQPSSKATYINNVSSMGSLARWDTADSPLGVYIGDASRQSKRFKATYGTEVRKALDTWSRALNGAVRFKMVASPADAKIQVSFNDRIESNTSGSDKHAGITHPTIDNGRLMKANIDIRTVSPAGQPFTNADMAMVALHEVGHALGLLGHSPDTGDVMHASSPAEKLSARDIATIRQLYAQPLEGQSETASDTGGTDARLSRLNAEVKLAKDDAEQRSRSWLNWQNYGITLLNRGKYKRKLNNSQPSPDSLLDYREALDAFERSLVLDDSQAMVHVYRAYVYEEMNEPRQALNALEDALRTNSSLPEAHREKAWLYAGMGDKIKANMALQEYIRRNPSARTSSEVAQIRRRIQGI